MDDPHKYAAFFEVDMKQEIINKIKEIKEKRTHCQCSRAKVVERIAFEEIIVRLESVSEWNADDVVRMLKEQAEIKRHPSDSQIFKTAYNYAVKIVEHYEQG